MANIYTEQYLQVVDNQLAVSIKVGPDDELGELVQLTTENKRSVEHFGELRLVMEPAFAVALAQAILSTATYLKTSSQPQSIQR